MKYKVTHTHLMATLPATTENPNGVNKVFKLDEIVSDKALEAAGFDVNFLIANKAVEKLEGQDVSGDDAGSSSVSRTPRVVAPAIRTPIKK